jgi:hypothetical protein
MTKTKMGLRVMAIAVLSAGLSMALSSCAKRGPTPDQLAMQQGLEKVVSASQRARDASALAETAARRAETAAQGRSQASAPAPKYSSRGKSHSSPASSTSESGDDTFVSGMGNDLDVSPLPRRR